MFHTSYFGKLKDSRSVDVEEIVSLFLHIIAYHVKNWVIKFRFLRCGENDNDISMQHWMWRFTTNEYY